MELVPLKARAVVGKCQELLLVNFVFLSALFIIDSVPVLSVPITGLLWVQCSEVQCNLFRAGRDIVCVNAFMELTFIVLLQWYSVSVFAKNYWQNAIFKRWLPFEIRFQCKYIWPRICQAELLGSCLNIFNFKVPQDYFLHPVQKNWGLFYYLEPWFINSQKIFVTYVSY